MKKLLYIVMAGLITTTGCKTSEDSASDEDYSVELEEFLDMIYSDSFDFADYITVEEDLGPYQASYPRAFDLLHTTLHVTPDWQSQRLDGRAYLTLKPHFYATSVLTLDAKGFDIHSITMGDKPLLYRYPDSMKLEIELGAKLTREDTFEIEIKYTAKPAELASGSSNVSSSDQGLFFVNHDDSDPDKPRQLWTQGETESSSCWFPTIDAPNERTTQEMFITVESGIHTVSNGVLASSSENDDGSRTDHWVMDQPHAPYLFMMAAGPYAKVEDTWRDIPVDYYVDSTYAPYAKNVFGHTPEMMEFYSTILGVSYPWPKYAQVVAHDFVSGAMENTTATIYYDELHKTDRELLDSPQDDIIAHELFHHWFGDLVTCESWANIALNESFATYGEYLWSEYKYGRDHADHYLKVDLDNYFSEASYKQEPLIRTRYEYRDEVFDRHSYQKGGRVLHMLRKEVGDEAFFASLKLYLDRHAYTAVEFHDLRLAFEDVTGKDMNWFFKQWFETAGHPKLIIDYGYDVESDQTTVYVTQDHSTDSAHYWRLPVCVDVYRGNLVERVDLVIEGEWTEWSFDGQPDLINVDAEKMLLCEKSDLKTHEQYVFQYNNAPLYLDRLEALEECAIDQWHIESAAEVLLRGLDDPAWAIRKYAVDNLENTEDILDAYAQRLEDLAANDPKAAVRATALSKLAEQKDATASVFVNALTDSSFNVMAEALSGLLIVAPEKSYEASKKYWGETNNRVAGAVAEIVATKGDASAEEYFQTIIPKLKPWGQFSVVNDYGEFISKQGDEVIMRGASFVRDLALGSTSWFVKTSSTTLVEERIEAYEGELENKPSTERKQKLGQLIAQLKEMLEEMESEGPFELRW